MTDQAMSPLRRRMIEDMTIRKFAPKTQHDYLAGKIIVDPSNPLAPDGKGGFKKTIPADQSSGQLIAAMLPEGAKPVKAFGTLGAESLGSAVNRSPERAVLFYATDYADAGASVAALIEASGFSPVSVGRIDQSIRIEVGGDLHEFGKLGRLVSAKEAEALV
jgi:predicted dinucleotide-binding enzyme